MAGPAAFSTATVSTAALLASLTAACSTSVSVSIGASTAPTWTAISSISLIAVGGSLNIGNSASKLYNDKLKTVSLPYLTYIKDSLLIDATTSKGTSNTVLTYVSMPLLASLGGSLQVLSIKGTASLNHVLLPALAVVTGNIYIDSCWYTSDGKLDLTALTFVGGYLHIANNAKLATIVLDSAQAPALGVKGASLDSSTYTVRVCGNAFNSSFLSNFATVEINVGVTQYCVYDNPTGACAVLCSAGV